jgi:hypothetical protein
MAGTAPPVITDPNKPYDPNDESTWGDYMGTDGDGTPYYSNQPQYVANQGSGGASPSLGDVPLYNDAKKSFTDPVGFVKGVLGMGGDGGAAAQTQLAKDVTAQSTGNAQTLYQQALAQAASANAIRAPGAITVPAVTAQQLDAGKYNVSTDTTADSEDATVRMRAYQAALATAGDATSAIQRGGTVDVQSTPGAYVPGVNTMIAAPTIGEAAQTGKTTVGSTALDPLANQLRGEQISAARSIASAPSAAMSQFKAGLSQVTADQLATAERARGAERAGARRDAMIAIGSQGAQQNLSAAALSAQEEQAKRVASAASLSGVRSSDVATTTTQAEIDSRQATLQAQIDVATAQGNTAAVNSLRTQQAQLSLDARKAEVAGSLTQQGQIAQLSEANMQAEQQRNVLNATAKNQAERDYQAAMAAAAGQTAANQTTVSLANAQGTTAASKDYATAVNTAAADAAARQTQANLANAALTQQQAQTNAARAATLDTTNVTTGLAAGTTSAANALDAQKTNASNQLSANQLQQTGATSAINAGTGAVGIQSKDAQTITDANKSGSAAEAQEKASLIGAGGAIISKVASDERVKENIAPVGGFASSYEDAFAGLGGDGQTDKEEARREVENLSPEDVRDWASALQPIVFDYKPGHGDNGASPTIGLSANKVEESGPLGQIMVGRDRDGTRVLDYGAATLMLSKTAFDLANEAKMMASQRSRR